MTTRGCLTGAAGTRRLIFSVPGYPSAPHSAPLQTIKIWYPIGTQTVFLLRIDFA